MDVIDKIMTTGNREDYLIAILRLTEGGGVAKTTELASFMGVSPASVSEMVKNLAKDGLVEYAKYRGVKLTEDGLREARLTRKRHHVVERFLRDVLGYEHQEAHEEASVVEHSISDETAVKMCNMLGNPPDCDCQVCISPCRAVSASGVAITMVLSDMHVGEKGTISHLKDDEESLPKKLLSMGLVPGKDLILEHVRDGSYVVDIDGESIAIDEVAASAVFVDLEEKIPGTEE